MRTNQDPVNQTKIFLFSYEFNNATWNVEIPAADMEEAKQRIKLIANAKFDGELTLKIDIPCNN